MQDPPQNAQTVVNHNPSAYLYTLGAKLAAMPWIGLSSGVNGSDSSPKAAVVRYSNLLAGSGSGVQDVVGDNYDVFYASTWFGELQGATAYILRADPVAKGSADLAGASSQFSTLASSVKRGALQSSTLLEQKTASEARSLLPTQ